MADISIDAAAARAAALARSLTQSGLSDNGPKTESGPSGGLFSSFGDMLRQLQQRTVQVLNIAAPVETPSPLLLSPPFSPSTLVRQIQAREAQSPTVGRSAAAETGVRAPAATSFGHWEQRPVEGRPYSWLAEDQLDAFQKRVVDNWNKNPYFEVWVYDVPPTAENNWAGWGPSPGSWVGGKDSGIPNGASMTWPPPGQPPAGWNPDPANRLREILSQQ